MVKWLQLMLAVLGLFTLCWGEMACWDYLVSGPQGVPDSAMRASSYHPLNSWHHKPACGRLHMYHEWSSSGCPTPNIGAWCSETNDPNPHIQVKFSGLKKVVGIVIQQRQSPSVEKNDIRTYHVLYSTDGENWEYVKSDGVTQTFDGPTDAEDILQYGTITPSVIARYIRIRPITWSVQSSVPCLRFDVIGCNQDTRRRRFVYRPLPTGSINDNDVLDKVPAKDLRECSLQCHRQVTCLSFSYSDIHKKCEKYNVNKYTRLTPPKSKRTISDKQYLYYSDMGHIDMTTDELTGLMYKVITRNYNKEDAMAACNDLGMMLLVVNSESKLDLVRRVKSSSLILGQEPIIVNGGKFSYLGMTKWWDGEDQPQPLKEELFELDNTQIGLCVVYEGGNKLRRYNCNSELFSICEKRLR